MLGDGVAGDAEGLAASYSDIAETEDYKWPLSAFVPGVLEKWDLPDCYQALEEKKLKRVL